MFHSETRMRKMIGTAMLAWILVLITLVAGQEDLSSKYVGCFHGDGTSSTTETARKNVAVLSIATCIDECLRDTSNPMTFAGLTNGTACVCMNENGAQIPDTACSASCTGASKERCGGIGSTTVPIYSIYTVCPVGYFGKNCSTPCHCKSQQPCDRNTGVCKHGCDEYWTGTNCSTRIVITTLEYIGCFKDDKTSAIEKKNPGGKTGAAVNRTTIEMCIDICALLNYSFAGLQYHYDCFCGNGYDRYGTSEAFCNRSCSGNPRQMCGGSWANSVYNVCPTGFYGPNCLSRCNCGNNTERCNFGTCSSLCKPGWSGESCNIRNCSINNGDCELNEECEEVNLGYTVITQCRCKAGYNKVENECKQSKVHDHYVGCHKMRTTSAVDKTLSLPPSDWMTDELCVIWCRRLNTTFSILTNEAKCTCTDDVGESVPDHECNRPVLEDQEKHNGRKYNASKRKNTLYIVYSVCPIGSFGIGCDMKCHCVRDSLCRRNSGSCYTNCSKHWTGPSCNSTRFLSPQYLGCYREGKRDLHQNEVFSKHHTGDRRTSNSIENCRQTCSPDDYTYFGLQYGRDCHCGEAYDTYGEIPDGECRMPCSGNREQKCGGNYANSVYAFCPFGTYGRNCSDQCNCAEGAVCTLIRGLCPSRCKPGWSGNKCNNPVTTGHWCSADSGECLDDETCAGIDLGYVNISRCRCKDGFWRKYPQQNCTDYDECQPGNSRCNDTISKCVNTIGNYSCNCKPGFQHQQSEGDCLDIDECENNTALCDNETATCQNNFGSYECSCNRGFTKLTNGSCVDIDECHSENNSCNATTQNCFNNFGGYTCKCKPGFEPGPCPNTCFDVNECEKETADCNIETQMCRNTLGSYACLCRHGFTNLTDGSCVDLDECKTENSVCDNETQICRNSFGSYVCLCNIGFTALNDAHCTDINECEDNRTCASAINCTNTIGSFYCSYCPQGYINRNRDCELPSYYSGSDSQGSQGPVIGGLAGAFVILLILSIAIIAVVILKLRNATSQPKKDDLELSNGKALGNNGNSGKAGASKAHEEPPICPLIRVKDLHVVFQLKKVYTGTLEKEFRSVPIEDSTKSFTVAKNELKTKNRFQNILPYDQNRVKLSKSGNEESSDYINASFITSYNKADKIIAAQGPNPDTLTDFWRMIYENNVATIVMITNLIENGKKKCAQYWPEPDENMKSGDITIRVKSTETWPTYTVRHLKLIKGTKNMDIKQWHFTTWPDHGVPSDIKGFLDFRRSVKQSAPIDKFTLIHCSAGVGRTGTFIAINYLLQQAEGEGSIDILSCLRRLREQRTQMVQTLDQYEFIHAALAIEFEIGKTVVRTKDFDNTFQQLMAVDKSTGKRRLDIQFEVLQQQCHRKEDDVNPFRVLSKSEDYSSENGDSDAVFVQSWKRKNAFIVSDYPKKKAVNNLWNTINEYDCKVIVHVGDNQSSEAFYPQKEGSELPIADWQIQCRRIHSDPCGKSFDLSLLKYTESEYANTTVTTSKELKLLYINPFRKDNSLKFDSLSPAYDKLQKLLSTDAGAASTPIFIVSGPQCSVGGLCVAAFNAFEMLGGAKEVDVFQIVYDVKKSKSQLIPSLTIFEQLHHIVNHRIACT